ncbi:MAG TPA: hypothetical protein VHV32_05445 [Candidatus Angelobacter sp.]|nr:hypothetical protein [Candidatus Angelobacter sp.]
MSKFACALLANSYNTVAGGHLLYPASITFAASPASAGSISFNIDRTGNFNGANNAAKYYAGGALLENVNGITS